MIGLTARRALTDDRGSVLIEFALILPLFLLVILLGSDYAYYVYVRQQVASAARMTADNAARIGEEDTRDIKRVSEAAITDVLLGGIEQATGLDLEGRGRIILSSLERNVGGSQWIHWQRCAGNLDYASSQGGEGDAVPGMGATHLQAPKDTAIMFVEIAYEFQPLFGLFWTPGGGKIVEMAAFRVRELRDLTQIYNEEAIPPAQCAPEGTLLAAIGVL